MADARDVVRRVIRRSGMKQVAVAERAGMTKQQLSDVVNKRRRLEADELFSICEALGITPNDIFAECRGDT